MVLALVLAVLGLLMLVVPWPFLYVAGARRGGSTHRAAGHGDATVRVLGALLLVAAFLVALANG